MDAEIGASDPRRCTQYRRRRIAVLGRDCRVWGRLAQLKARAQLDSTKVSTLAVRMKKFMAPRRHAHGAAMLAALARAAMRDEITYRADVMSM